MPFSFEREAFSKYAGIVLTQSKKFLFLLLEKRTLFSIIFSIATSYPGKLSSCTYGEVSLKLWL